MKICITVDMEQDCPPYFSTYKGVEFGTDRLLSLFKQEKVFATFFTTGDVAHRYPEIVKDIVDQGHELGCHGYSHDVFDKMNWETAEEEIDEATKVLRKFYPVVSFRAPNLRFPHRFLPLLTKYGYQLDSSQAKYKWPFYSRSTESQIKRISASVTSSILRLPRIVRYPYLLSLKSPAVCFVHPWEFVDMRKEKLRLDCRFRTGEKALHSLRQNIHLWKGKKATFHKMQELI